MPSLENRKLVIYDLETFGLGVKNTQVAQFAARTYSPDLNPLDDGTVLYCRLPVDRVPSIGACLVNGITPQFAAEHGENELEFARKARAILLNDRENTIVAGYNNCSFDNWVINHMLFRNLLRPYEPFKDRTADCFTLAKAVHALDRGKLKYMQVPKADGTLRDSLRLEHMSRANGLIHSKAHDALSDVEATAGLMSLIKSSCPEIYGKWLSGSVRSNPLPLIESSARSSMPILAVTGPPLADSTYATLVLVIANDANSFFAVDLLCPDDKFDENLTAFSKAQSADDLDYVAMAETFCLKIKVNEDPYVDYPEKYYSGRPDEDAMRSKVDARMARIEAFRLKDYISINSFALKGKRPSSPSGSLTAANSSASLLDGTANGKSLAQIPVPVEETLIDGGLLDRNARELMEVAESGGVEDIREALSSMGKRNLPRRAQTLFSHMVGRNFPELFGPRNQERWRGFVRGELERQRETFVNEYGSLVSGGLKESEMRIAQDVAEYEKEVFDSFSLRLF